MSSELGSGSVLAVALVGGLAALAALSLPLYLGFAVRQAVASAADAAALAAADVALGIVAGYPCEVAARVATANGASLTGCDLDGLVATVSTERFILGIPVTARASAGPAPGEAD